jgi:hypothetical protein
MTQQQPTKTQRIRRVVRTVAAIALAVAIASFALPALRKGSAISRIGDRTIAELSAFATAVSYSENMAISRLAQSPQIDADFRRLTGLFAQVSIQKDYARMILLTRGSDGQYRVLADGAYLENTPAGSYDAPDSPYLPGGQKAIRNILDAIYSGKTAAAYAPDLIARPGGGQAVAVYLPVYGNGAAVLGILGVECDPGGTVYHMVGPVNLTWVGGAAALLAALCVLLLYLGRRFGGLGGRQPAPEPPAPEPPADNPEQPLNRPDDPSEKTTR